MSELTLKPLAGSAGLASLPGLADVWDHALRTAERVHDDQDMGRLNPEGTVELTIKVTMSRRPGASAMDVSHTSTIKTPAYTRSSCTAHRSRDGRWQHVDEAEQAPLPFPVTQLKPRS